MTIATTGQLAVNCFVGWLLNSNIREVSELQMNRMSVLLWTRGSVHLAFQCVFMSFSLWKGHGTGGWLQHRWVFLDSLTGGLALIREHSCTVLSSPPCLHSSFSLHLSDFSFHFVVQSLSLCILHLSWAVFSGVRDEMASGHSTKKYTRSWEKKHHIVSSPLHAALVCHFLSTHSNMCEWACTCRHTHTKVHTHTYTHVVAAHFI